MFSEDDSLLEAADELLELFSFDEILEMNDLELREFVARGIAFGLIMDYNSLIDRGHLEEEDGSS